MNNTVFSSVDNYITNLFAREDDTLIAINKSIEEAGLPQQSISPNQGKFLQTLALICHAKKILEIGTFAGYSTTWLARALPADGSVVSLEFDATHKALAEKNIANAGLDSKVEIRLGKALELLPAMEEEGAGPFDMIFIDADKPLYANYLEWAVRLGRRGTLIVADNVIRDGKVLDGHSDDEKVKGVQKFNLEMSKNLSVTGTIIQTVGVKEYDGMAIGVIT